MRRYWRKPCGTDCDGHEKTKVGMVRAVKRTDETENILAVAEMKMGEGSALAEDRSCNGKTMSEGT